MALPAPAISAGLLDDDDLAVRIFGHLDRGTTDMAEGTWREPVEHYRSPARLRREIDAVLRAHPVPFCPSAALPSAGSHLARDAAGVPIVAVRDRDGVVHAFLNVCRHRGAVVASGRGCGKSLACPYHGWVYGLDGSLRHVPDQHGFPGLDKASRGLVAIGAVEQGGLVSVRQGPPDPDAALSEADLPELIGSDQVLVDSSDGVVEANWKVLVEGFLEGYHLKATHRDTFLPFGYDNVTVVETFGRHSRVTFPFRRIERLRFAPTGGRNLDGAVTFVYHLFPNVIVARLSHHTTMVVLEPLSIDRTNFVTYQLANGPLGTGEQRELARDTDFVTLGAVEDRDVALSVQRGLRSGANQALEFGRFEGAITHFHRQLTELVDESSPAS
jgi:phenylpropionate dioxygenase-like ring-hydroxylating dioxygenase large terminal subunit